MDLAQSTPRPNHRKSAAALSAAAVLLGLPLLTAGCTESPDAPPEPLTLATIDDGDGNSAVVVKEAASGEGVEDPQTVTSTLDVGAGSCYYLNQSSGSGSTMLVFPSGTTLEGGGTPSVVVDGEKVPQGTLISVTGEDIELTPKNDDQAEPCKATDGVFLVTSATAGPAPGASESPAS